MPGRALGHVLARGEREREGAVLPRLVVRDQVEPGVRPRELEGQHHVAVEVLAGRAARGWPGSSRRRGATSATSLAWLGLARLDDRHLRAHVEVEGEAAGRARVRCPCRESVASG